jgi:hypothetical protein
VSGQFSRKAPERSRHIAELDVQHVRLPIGKTRTLERLFALFTLFTTTLTEPCAPEVVVRKAKIFALAFPSTRATLASVPGRFATRMVSSFAFGMEDTSCGPILHLVPLQLV